MLLSTAVELSIRNFIKTVYGLRRAFWCFCIAIGLFCLASEGPLAAQVSWVGGGTGHWEDPANWSNGMVPESGDDVAVSTGQPVVITHGSGQTRIRTLSMLGTLDIQGGSFAVSGGASIDGDLHLSTGTALIADGAGASIEITGSAAVADGDVLAVNGGRVTLPSTTRYQGGGRLRAEGPGSMLELKNLSSIGIGDPEPIDSIYDAISREYSAYHKPQAVIEGESKGILDAYSREVSGFQKPVTPLEGFEKGIFSAYSREVSLFHRPIGLHDEPGKVLLEGISREVSVFHRPLGLNDQPEQVLMEGISREVSVEHLTPQE